MKRFSLIVTSALFLIAFPAMAQLSVFSQKTADIEARLKNDVYTLSADSFLGREAGTANEIKARYYIIGQFKKIGLPPFFGDTTYIQPFDINGSSGYGINTLFINKIPIEFSKGFFPLDFSANGHAQGEAVKVGCGLIVPEYNLNDYKLLDVNDKIVIIDMVLPDSLEHIKEIASASDMRKRAELAASKGATGVIFINSSKTKLPPPQYASGNTIPISIPVIFANKSTCSMISAAPSVKADIITEIIRKESKIAYNVGAYLNNNARFTVIIGGHYDHIGFKENVMGKPTVYNGADDNASGTSSMIELARLFSDSTKEKYNFLFLGFSAEEKGLLGSVFFTQSNAINLSDIAFMINLDMIGRLDSTKKDLTAYATGTSPAWKAIIGKTDPAKIHLVQKDECRYGSDHFSFYSVNIPCLFFFTELHPDYHKPGDDAQKINYKGLTEIVQFVQRITNAVSSGKKLPFVRVNATN